MIEYSATSSAYIAILLCSTVLDAPSMYTRNKRGTRTDPWGTPETTSKGLDCAPPNTTDWVLLDNYVSTLEGMDLLGDGIIYAEVIDVGLSRRLCKDRKTG